MSKYSSDSNSRDRTRSYNRYFNQRHRSSSSSSTENSRRSKKYHSSKSGSRHQKKSKHSHRSDSSSEYSSSRHKHSSHSYHKDESRSKRRQYRKSSSTSDHSSYSNSPSKDNQSKNVKTSNNDEKYKSSLPNSMTCIQSDMSIGKSETVKDPQINNTDWLQQNVYDVMSRQNSIEQIKQEGFVFKVFKQKDDEMTEDDTTAVPKLNPEIINGLEVEESTFLISNRDRLLHGRHRLLTKQERSNLWARNLFETYLQSNSQNGMEI